MKLLIYHRDYYLETMSWGNSEQSFFSEAELLIYADIYSFTEQQ